MKKIFLVYLFLSFLFVFSSCSAAGKSYESFKHIGDGALYINSGTLVDYLNDNGYVTFKTSLILENPKDETVYVTIKGDFANEHRIKMIKERILLGYDPNTNGTVFVLPPKSRTIFEIWFSSDGNSFVKKPDRTLPAFMVEEIPKNEISENEIVTEFSVGLPDSDGAFIVYN